MVIIWLIRNSNNLSTRSPDEFCQATGNCVGYDFQNAAELINLGPLPLDTILLVAMLVTVGPETAEKYSKRVVNFSKA